MLGLLARRSMPDIMCHNFTYLSSRLMSLDRAGIQEAATTIELQRTATGETLNANVEIEIQQWNTGIGNCDKAPISDCQRLLACLKLFNQQTNDGSY